MTTNLDRFKNDLDALLELGSKLTMSMIYHVDPKAFRASLDKPRARNEMKSTADEFLQKLPSVFGEYQRWYSESIVLLRQLLPDRVADFVRHYEKPKGRKDISFENYRIEDFLQGLRVTRGDDVVVDSRAAIPHFQQQLAMLEAAKARFESSLFEIRQLVQADLLDSELEAAEILAKHNFTRAAGTLAGVVLERHLSQVCADRKLPLRKTKPTIADVNETLKAGGAIDLPQWRFIGHLADIRNLCTHSGPAEPTTDQVADLLAGAKKVTKTVY